jgi:hypothetical protein
MILTGSRCRYPELARKSRLLWPVANCTSPLFSSDVVHFPGRMLVYTRFGTKESSPFRLFRWWQVPRVWDEIRQDLWSHLQIEDGLVSWGEAHHAIPGALLDS